MFPTFGQQTRPPAPPYPDLGFALFSATSEMLPAPRSRQSLGRCSLHWSCRIIAPIFTATATRQGFRDFDQFAAPDFRPSAGGFFIGSRALFSCACLMIWAKTVSPPVP